MGSHQQSQDEEAQKAILSGAAGAGRATGHFQGFNSVYKAGEGFICLYRREPRCYKTSIPTSNLARSVPSFAVRSDAMTSKQQRVWQELCLKAVMEPDPQKQTAIVVELNRILQNQSKKAKSARVNRLPRQRSA